ncbi:peptidoglycan DD-metalloendopeptidase family protein [Moorella naiadis]|uniref:peptidoglycan DD-metalloendopeptidase family protein n=1 Tax=Moorella naiadis (nom. illeg.) TaxID=3093670 RepID=UPI003D9C94BE
MLSKKMAVTLVLTLAMLATGPGVLPARAAVIDDLQQVATTMAPAEYQQLASRVNSYTRIYRVEEGDTLERLGRRFQADPELIAVMNDLEPGAALTAGQFLVLPHMADQTYTVTAGDTLWSIARRYSVDAGQLAAANGIADSHNLRVGTILTIPGSPAVAAVRPAVSLAARSIDLKPAAFLVWPLIGAITSGFGWRGSEFHHGLDIAGNLGDKIRAALAGTVVLSGWGNSIYGQMVKIDHGNGLETVYAHTSRNLVQTGEYVQAGQVIAEVGATGNATGPHLHFEVREKGRAINPEVFLTR